MLEINFALSINELKWIDMELHTSTSIDSRSIHEKNRITTLGSSLSFLGIKPWHSDIRTCKDEMPAGETPCTIALYVRDDLVDAIQPGDRVEVTGIYRAIPLRVNHKTHIELLHFRKSNAKRLHARNIRERGRQEGIIELFGLNC